jgi:hypothetical protein
MTEHRPNPEPEEIIVPLDVVFTIWFVRDQERGGYQVGCHGLPEVAGYGQTLNDARADVVRDIKGVLQKRAEAGKPIPRLVYAPPWRKDRDWV